MMTRTLGQTFYLPDTLRNYPWKRLDNPHYRKAQEVSVAWLESFKPVFAQGSSGIQQVRFQYVGLLCSLTAPSCNYDRLRNFCDLMHLFFVIDEYTDPLDVEGVKSICEISIDAVMNPDKPRPAGENIVGEISRQFWARSRLTTASKVQERFITGWRNYLDSVVNQASHRETSYICTIDEFMAARRANIGIEPTYAFMEIVLGVDLPGEVINHSAITSIRGDVADMLFLTNDMYSYKKEVLFEDGNYNMVTIVMVNQGTDLAGAMQYISDLYDQTIDRFLKTREDVLQHRNGILSWGEEVDRQAEEYIECLGQWVRGHDEWSFCSGRYFGDEGLEVQKTRRVCIA